MEEKVDEEFFCFSKHLLGGPTQIRQKRDRYHTQTQSNRRFLLFLQIDFLPKGEISQQPHTSANQQRSLQAVVEK
jgi:hypothetical protein